MTAATIKATRRGAWLRRIIVSLCASMVAMLWLALIYDSKKTEDMAIEQAYRDIRQRVITFREHTARTVKAIDELTIAIATNHAKHPDDYEIPAWVGNLPLLKGMLKGLAFQVAMVGADGIIRASNLGLTGQVDVSDRPHIRHHFDPAAYQPYISVPVIGRVSGKWSVQFTRRLTRGDGTFNGVVVISVDPFYFSQFIETLGPGQNDSAILVGRDGVVRARRALNNATLGQDITNSTLFKKLQNAESGTYIAASIIDRIERVFGFSTVPDYPLVVALGIPIDDVLAPSRYQRKKYFAIGAIGTIVIIALTWILLQESRRRRRQEMAEHAKEKLKEQKLQLDTALENMSQGLLMFDASMRLVLCNQRYLDMYGLSSKAVKPGISFLELIDLRLQVGSFAGNPQSYCDEIVAEIKQGKTTRHLITTPDGRDIQIINHQIANGGWVATHEDITAQKQAEQERDRNREVLDMVIENIPTAIILKDVRDLRYYLINRAGEEYYGIPRNQMIGKTAYDVLPKESADHLTALDKKLLGTPQLSVVDEHELKLTGRGKRIAISKRLCIFNNGEPQYLLAVVEDITERKKVAGQLQQAQKMEAVGNLTGGLAHDFNNLLTVIIGNLDLLIEDATISGAHKEKLGIILQASERGATLTRQLLAFSRRQPLQAKLVDVNNLIEHTTKLLQRTLGEDITIKLRLNPDLWSPLVDSVQLETAIVNIAINARDAMPEGGILSISTRNADIDLNEVDTGAGLAPGAYVAIEISDTGAGMAPEVLTRIFEPFFTTKSSGKGTGLGLSMVYGFIKQSGGYISALSEVGAGTTFKLYLPRSAAVVAAQDTVNAEAQEAPSGANGKVILAVDDNSEVRTTAVTQLKSLGYRVLEADSAQAALEILDHEGNIDLLFTDIVMPGGANGKELASRAQAIRPDLKVLFTSGFPDTSLNGKSPLRSGDILLSKPYRKQDLAAALDNILRP